MLGAEVRFVAPRTMLPAFDDAYDVEVHHELASGIEGVDVIMALRIQHERKAGNLLPSVREYSRKFGINQRALGLAADDCLVMHPGPMNRGVEIDPIVADSPQSLVLSQVEAGVAVRMSLLYLLAGEGKEAPTA